jgi:hypothetical protein
LTTAGSTRVTIPENDADAGTGSGTFSGVALVPANADIALIADVRPDTIEPIRIPITNVRTRNADASSFRRRAQPKISRTCCPIACLLLSSRKKIPAVTKYNTSIHDGLRMHSAAAEPILYERPGIEMFSVAAVRFAGIVLLKL